MEMKRRTLLTGMASLIVAPAIVHYQNLMPVKVLKPERPKWLVCDGRYYSADIYPELFQVMRNAGMGFTEHYLDSSKSYFQVPNMTSVENPDRYEHHIPVEYLIAAQTNGFMPVGGIIAMMPTGPNFDKKLELLTT